MPRYLAALTIVLFVGMVVTRLLLLKRQGIAALKFGDTHKTDFLIPPFALFYFYLVFAAAFGLPTLSSKEIFHSGISEWLGLAFCFTGLSFLLWSLISFGKSFRITGTKDPPHQSAQRTGPHGSTTIEQFPAPQGWTGTDCGI